MKNRLRANGIGLALLAFALATIGALGLELAGCSAQATPSQQEQNQEDAPSSAEETDAMALLGSSTESGEIPVLVSWSISAPNHQATTTYTYDAAGNLTEEATDMTDYGTHVTTLTTTSYDTQTQEPLTLTQTFQSPGGKTINGFDYEPTTLTQTGEGSRLSFTALPKSENESAWVDQKIYDLPKDPLASSLTIESYTNRTILLAGQTSNYVEPTEKNSMSTTCAYNEDGTLATFTIESLGKSGVTQCSYDKDTITLSGKMSGLWRVKKDAAGQMVEVVNEEAQSRATFTYELREGFTNVNRAMAAVRPAQVFSDVIISS